MSNGDVDGAVLADVRDMLVSPSIVSLSSFKSLALRWRPCPRREHWSGARTDVEDPAHPQHISLAVVPESGRLSLHRTDRAYITRSTTSSSDQLLHH